MTWALVPPSRDHGACRCQRGSSLISVMVALSVCLLAIGLAVSAYKQHIFARKLANSGSASKEVAGPVTGALMNSFVGYVRSKCSSNASINNISLGRIGTLALVHSVAVPKPGSIAMPAEFKAAMQRCRATATLQSGTSAAGTLVPANRLYGCFAFNAQTTAKAQVTNESFLRSPSAFVEFTGVLQNFPSATAIGCQQAAMTTAAPGNGIAAYYALHWVVPSSSGPLYKTKYGVMYSDLQ